MSFREDVIDDVGRVFLDPAEFGREIEFDGHTVTAVVDDSQDSLTTGSGGGFADSAGLALLNNAGTLHLADVLPRRPVPEQQVEIDGEL